MAPKKQDRKQLTKINAIPLRGGVDKVRDRVQLPFMSFSDVNNLRPMHPGFEQRKGMATKHTTADGTNECITLYQSAKGRRVEKSFFAQMGDGDVLKATDLPPTVTTGVFGTEIHNGTESGMIPASWSTLADIMMYSNGVDQHQVYAGTNNYVHAVVRFSSTTAAPGTIPTEGTDYTVQATDGKTSTEVVLDDFDTIAGATYEALYIMTPVPATQLTWTFTATWVNTAAAVGTLKYRKSDHTWADAAETDGTISVAGKTLSGDGSMTWAAKTDEIPMYMFGRSGYWYQWETATKLTDANGVRPTSITYGHATADDFHSIENVWDGILSYAIEVVFYDYDATDFAYLQLSPNDAEVDDMVAGAGGGADCDILYWNSWDKSWGIYVDVGDTPNYDATTAIVADDIQYWTGAAWASAGATITDGTNGLTNSGFITWKRNSEEPRQFNTGQYYSYWHRLWITGANLGSDVRIGIQPLPYFDIDDFGQGVTSGTWKDRPTYTFDRYGHYIHVGATNRPMSLNGTDYGILLAGDGRHNKVLCQKKFKNELMVWQEELGLEGGCVTLFEGYSPSTYGKLVLSTKVGTFSAKTVEVVEGVLTSTKTDETLQDLVFFISRIGICATDGKSIQVVSDQVQHHFDPTDTTNCIRYGYEKKMFLSYDSAYNGLVIGLVTGASATTCNTFLFFDLIDKVFMYDTRGQNISCMAEVEAASGNIPVLQYGGGTDDGTVYRLNTGTNDVDVAEVTTPIDSYITIEFGYEGLLLSLRELLARMKVQAAGDITVTPYTNETAGTDMTLTMTAKTTGDASRRHRTGLKLQGDSISLRFRNATASQEMVLYDVGVIVYELEGH